MRLKSLDLVGFKSFLEPTVISFDPGVTAVVGPNGCGKSNVVDAIRWVLGEQAPTRLRGKSAEDLIYAGNESNQPAGMAEVTLLLEAEDAGAIPEPYSMLSEVAVTRRVYRSGDAEYLLNRIPCRLKDITEFFMASQIHSRGYALVEQGRIDEIIQAKPDELRAMVEEAAGLSLFKGRREMSERKLERVRENLTRVADVLSEIERQLDFARRQAKKAEAYRVVRAELAELEQLTAARRILDEQAELAGHAEREAQLRDQALEARAMAESSRQAAEEAAAALAAARDACGSTERDLVNLRAAFAERARTRDFLERRLHTLDELTPQLASRSLELTTKVTAARAGRAEAGARLARARRANDSNGDTRLAELRETHRAAERNLRENERRVEELKDELADLMREAAVTRGRLGDLAGECAETQDRLAELVQQTPSPELMEEARSSAHRAEAALQAGREHLAACENLQHENAEAEFQLRAALTQSLAKLTAASDARDRAGAAALRIMPNGAGERLRGVLESLNGDGPVTPPAMLLDIMKAPPALEPALRAVLGEQLDAVIVDSPHFAVRAIELLKQHNTGRLSFIPDALQGAAGGPEPLHAPGIAGRLLEMVEVESRFAPLAEALLGHVLIADDLHAALAATNLNGHGAVFVTRDGDMLWPDRMISGGSGGHHEDAGEIDMRKRAAALADAERVAAAAAADHEELLRHADWARLALGDELAELARRRSEIAGLERHIADTRAILAKIEQQTALAAANRAAAERRLGEVANLARSANVRLEELAHAEQALRARLTEAAAALAAARLEARRLGDELLELGAQVAARKAALVALEQELRHQRDTADGLERQLRELRVETSRMGVERAEFERELATLAEQDASTAAQQHALEAAFADLQLRNSQCESAVAAARASLMAAREQADALDAELTQCQLKGERARTLAGELERGFAEKFQTAFAAVVDELTSRLAERDGPRDAERLTALRARVERIGEVNLAAESEVKELEERAASLGAERQDLQRAADDLAHTIQKLNREARKRFADTFEGAARNFAELFPKLMRGGKGRLELSAADDVLEAGINLLIQPAGKRVKELALLSGGEKALSAMALIFSLFLLNPSPFCVMDEVDAPLDEFSLAAFTTLVRELKLHSQFIIITHNQRTMQAADQIHGVTMERPGISRIISLKIPQAA
jgi:chromosome segregation protein